MKLNKLTPKKKTAQAMVEFAIVLPILLLLLYGLLEAGRLLFMYSTIVTASRQAVRYGSATGDGMTAGVARFDDCTGIRLAANKVDYLNAFDHTSIDVTIGWDNGGGTLHPICPTGQATDGWTPAGNGDRLVVTVTGHFHPIVPKLVPFANRDIVATSRRTILVSVPIVVNAPGATTPTIQIVDQPNPSELGQAIPIVVTVTDPTGTGTPTGKISLSFAGNPIIGCIDLPLSGGTVTCNNVVFYASGDIIATYTSDTSDYASTTSGPKTHTVGATPVTVTVQDIPTWSLPGQSVTIRVTVRSTYDPGGTTIIPTGSVMISNSEGGTCGPITLSGGIATCSAMVFNTAGFPTITAVYTSDDATKYKDGTGTGTHEVMTNTPTATRTPLPTNTPTQTPIPSATSTTTPAVTPVLGCNSIRDQFGANPIQIYHKTMYLEITNPNPYSVTMSNIFVRWNYNGGRIGGNGKLTLKTIDLNGTTFWTGSENVPLLTIPLSPPVVLPGNGVKSRITFTFDYTYGNPGGEELQIDFSTPGCELYSIHVQNQ